MADLDREILFSNESFVINMLQAVSGGSIVAALSQFDTLLAYAGSQHVRTFITCMTVSIGLAVLAGYLKHLYKMWDVKAGAKRVEAMELRSDKKIQEAEMAANEWQIRTYRSSRYLNGMRFFISCSVFAILLGMSVLTYALWVSSSLT